MASQQRRFDGHGAAGRQCQFGVRYHVPRFPSTTEWVSSQSSAEEPRRVSQKLRRHGQREAQRRPLAQPVHGPSRAGRCRKLRRDGCRAAMRRAAGPWKCVLLEKLLLGIRRPYQAGKRMPDVVCPYPWRRKKSSSNGKMHNKRSVLRRICRIRLFSRPTPAALPGKRQEYESL